MRGTATRIGLGLLVGALLVIVPLGPGRTAETTSPAASPPNVLVLIIDDARAGDLRTMPVVRSLVGAAGATFTHSYSPLPQCCPARATFLTGQYAHNHGVLSNGLPHGGFHMFDDSSTVATWLDPSYETAWIGKYLNQYSERCCSTYVPPGWDTWRAALGQSFADYMGTRFNIDGRLVDYSGHYQTNVLANFAVDFINAKSGQGRPFLLFTSFFAPHTGTPIEPDDPPVELTATPYVHNDRDAFQNESLSMGGAFNEADVSDKPAEFSNLPSLTADQVTALTELNQQRHESLLAVERGVRRIVNTLKSTGELANTYIILTSDNGFMLGEHRIATGKNVAYEPAVNVPLLVRGPRIPAGITVRQPVGGHDLAPTILAMTEQEGAQGDSVLDGVNLLDLIADPALLAHRPIVLESGPRTGADTAFAFHGIRTPRWKYVEYDTGEVELYDLRNDPHELTNIANRSAYAATQSWLAGLLDRYADCEGLACR